MSADYLAEFARLPDGNYRRPCPVCDKSPRDTALSVLVDGDRVVGHCFRCEWSAVWSDDRFEIRRQAKPPARPAAQTFTTLSDYGRDLWNACRPLADVARDYLDARVCVIPPADGDLRWHPELKHPGGYVGPALVGLITDAVTNEPISLHRTWIEPDGGKAPADPPRLLLARHRKAGGVIRLWPDNCVTTGLAIAEGIESALSAAHAITPAWALIDAGNLSQFPVLPRIESLTIFADADRAGLSASRICAERWAIEGRDVRIVEPPEGQDINDVARRAEA
jgi:putative DNA primase/helicase